MQARDTEALRWLQCGDELEAHFCAVDEKKAAAICGYASTKQWHRPLYDLEACPKCEAIERSGVPINFKMPDGRTVTVRGRVAAH